MKTRLALIASLILACTGSQGQTGFLYYAGGAVNDSAVADPALDGTPTGDFGVRSVLVADVDTAAGTVSNWRRAGQLLPEAGADAADDLYSWMFLENAVHVYNGRLYVGPGDWNGDAARDTADVVAYAQINADGSLSPFNLSPVFPDSPADQAIGATAIVETSPGVAYYYILGGTPSGATRVIYAPIAADGSIGAWASTTPLPVADWFNRATASGNTIIHGSGNLQAPSGRATVYNTANANGTLNAWVPGAPYEPGTENRWDYAMVTVEGGAADSVVILGGAITGGITQSSVHVAPVVAGVPGAYTVASSLPAPRRRVTAASADNLVIVPGGGASGVVTAAEETVFIGTLTAPNTITWATSPNPMFQRRSFGGAAYYAAPTTKVEDWQVY